MHYRTNEDRQTDNCTDTQHSYLLRLLGMALQLRSDLRTYWDKTSCANELRHCRRHIDYFYAVTAAFLLSRFAPSVGGRMTSRTRRPCSLFCSIDICHAVWTIRSTVEPGLEPADWNLARCFVVVA